MTSTGIDWADIRKKLPYERTEEQKKKRMDMFNQFDPNANGYLSLAEVHISKLIPIAYALYKPLLLEILGFVDDNFI